jgi:arginase
MQAFTSITIVTAPTSLGLRPNSDWLEPTTWRAPDAFLKTGIAEKLGASIVSLPHPNYDFDAQFGTKIRNGLSIRAYTLQLANEVEKILNSGKTPVVLGGDCSILLGCLLGMKRCGGRGLVHVDGHCDYFHPGNYDVTSRLGSVAGMDLALATGKGELLLTHWDNYADPLVAEDEAFHIGERNFGTETFEKAYSDIISSAITMMPLQRVFEEGLENTAHIIVSRLKERNLSNVWLHVDFDILDQTIMPAVDSPGTPGLQFKELEHLLLLLLQSRLFIGLDFTIYDPGLDKENIYLPALATIIEKCSLKIGNS